MKWSLIILLIMNICYFGWELSRQTNIQVKNSVKPLNITPETKKLHVVLGDDSATVSSLAKNREQKTLEPKTSYITYNITNTVHSTLADFSQKITDVFKQITTRIFKPSHDSVPTQLKTKEKKCFSFGPFTDPYHVSMLSHWLTKNDIHAKRRPETARENTKYFWVYLALPVAQKKTTDIIKSLTKQNIADYKIIYIGTKQSAISLGVFSSLETAEKRLQEIENIGYHPIVTDYYKKTDDVWIDIKIYTHQTDETLYSLLHDYSKKFDLTVRKCTDIFPT